MSTSLDRAYQQFWDRLLGQIRSQYPAWPAPDKPPARNYLPLTSGMTRFSYTVSFGRRGLCSELYIKVPGDALASERILRHLQARSYELEAAYGSQLSYEYLSQTRPGRIACRLADYRPGSIRNAEKHDAYLDWFLESQARLRDALQRLGGLSSLRDQALT